LAGFYFDQSQWSKAREHFQKALHLNARLPNNYYHLAQIATREDQLLEAKEFYEKARELDPHEPKKTLAFAEFLVAHDQVGEGLLACREISTKYSDTLKPCLQVLKKHRVPLRLIKAAIPDDPVSHSTFSQYLKEQGEWLELSFWARKLNEEYPPTPQNIYLLAYSAFVQKEDQEALFFVQEGLKRFPAYADLILLHMDLLENQKKFHEISEIFTEQILLESPQTVWLEKYLDFLYAHKRMDEAQNLLSKIHSERPKSISIKELLVQFHQRNEQWAHAIKIYRQMISQGAANHKILEYRKNLAILYFQNGFFSEAIVQWEKIIRNEPRNEGILIALGESYQKKGNSQRALGYYERVLKISPQNENIRNRIEEIKEFRSF
jgi:tetratricopeptide (TPR) repeat protein